MTIQTEMATPGEMTTEAEPRAARYQRMLSSTDPVLREMGAALRDGNRPSDLLAVPAYRDVVMRGLDRIAESIEKLNPAEKLTPARN